MVTISGARYLGADCVEVMHLTEAIMEHASGQSPAPPCKHTWSRAS
jgi:hypothetical protein